MLWIRLTVLSQKMKRIFTVILAQICTVVDISISVTIDADSFCVCDINLFLLSTRYELSCDSDTDALSFWRNQIVDYCIFVSVKFDIIHISSVIDTDIVSRPNLSFQLFDS